MSLRSAVKALSVLTDPLLAGGGGITILIYHRVGAGTSSEVDLGTHAFRAHLEHLAAHCRVVSLDDAVAMLTAADAPGTRPDAGERDDGEGDDGTDRPQVVITFDDGTADFVDHAVPALVEAGMPATLYAATRFIHSGSDFPWGAPPVSWSALRDAVGTGLVTIGSHTHSHWLLDRARPDEVTADLDRSIELIAEHIGSAPQHFAYPKAVLGSPTTEAAVRARFRSAALARSRPNRPGRTDAHRLWRTPVQRSDTHAHFAAKAGGGMRLEGTLRDAAARWKYRGQTQ